MSELPSDDTSEQSRQNRCRIAKVSVYALSTEVHAQPKTSRLSRKPAKTGGRNVCGWRQPAADCPPSENFTSNRLVVGNGCGRGTAPCARSRRSRRSRNGRNLHFHR